ncbi:hypothetical protein WR25_15715 [Diploscapter pachys]|uniref:Uncharacterized protein n=1 Tax=Diploscapter pachys TaxID=2018661 RepID=A0A2A2J3R1_9BILA|nr:hypothetical protein WR25_15715 [Diploscapter pachys]
MLFQLSLFFITYTIAWAHPFELIPVQVPPCPVGSRPLLKPDGEPRKCLPHQNSLCVNALPDKPIADTVCCYHNQVDYFCCLDTTEDQCSDYHQVTVVIHNSQPHNPWAMKSFFFKEGIEDEIINDLNNEVKQDDGILVRLNREKKNNKN